MNSVRWQWTQMDLDSLSLTMWQATWASCLLHFSLTPNFHGSDMGRAQVNTAHGGFESHLRNADLRKPHVYKGVAGKTTFLFSRETFPWSTSWFPFGTGWRLDYKKVSEEGRQGKESAVRRDTLSITSEPICSAAIWGGRNTTESCFPTSNNEQLYELKIVNSVK